MSYEINRNKKEVVIAKNLVGTYSIENIGHEIINSYDCENNETNLLHLYIPPYGIIGGNSLNNFFKNEYKTKKYAMIFEKTLISGILKLKYVACNLISFKNEFKRKSVCDSLRYGNKYLKDIFKPEPDETQEVSLVSYMVKKDDYFDLEDKNIYIYQNKTKSEEEFIEKFEEAKHIFADIYGDGLSLTGFINTFIGTSVRVFPTSDDFYDWYDNVVKNLLVPENKANIIPLSQACIEKDFQYTGNTLLNFVEMDNMENLHTNFIYSELNNSSQLKNTFFKYLVKKIFKIENYEPSNVVVKKQVEILDEEQKLIKKYKKNKLMGKDLSTIIKKLNQKFNYSDSDIENIDNLPTPIDGFIDLYLEDDNYRIVIENKINSDLNGKYVEGEIEFSQIDKYENYLNRLNLDNNKNNVVAMLIPDYIMKAFEQTQCPKLYYSDLSYFFRENRNIIPSYADEFLESLYKHSFNIKELTFLKFKKESQ